MTAIVGSHPRTLGRTRLIGPLAAALVLAILTVVPSSRTAAQDASPTESPSNDVAPSYEGLSARMVRQVSRVIDSVHPVRGLPPADGVQVRVVDEATLAAELEGVFHERYPDAYLAAEDSALTHLGLIGPDVDLAASILGLANGRMVADYDPRTETLSLAGPARRIGTPESVVIAHEYAHALQDATFDLEAGQIKELDRSDAILAQQALTEGDATAVMYDWAARELDLADLLAVSARALTKQDEKALRKEPALLRRRLEFLYIDGFAFVNAIRGRGDWEAVDDVWRAQPTSTEQILHPELYPDEVPIEIDMPDLGARLGPGWAETYEQTLGEMQIGVWLADGQKSRAPYPVLPAPPPRAEAAAGWGGDRLVSLDGPGEAWAVVWQTEWDSRADAKEFRDAAREVVRDLPGAQAILNADVGGGLSSPVLVLLADGDTTLETVKTTLGLSP